MEYGKIFQKSPILKDEKAGIYFWCSCGLSAKQPYCDGTHKKTDFTPLRVEIEEDKKVAWCACKHSAGKPFCDGMHRNL